MLMTISKPPRYYREVRNDGFYRCFECGRYREKPQFEPETKEVPENLPTEPDWKALFVKYPPIYMKRLKTTQSEICSAWGISVKTLQRYIKAGRINTEGNEWFIVAYPWEEQSSCYYCRHQEVSNESEDPIQGYLRLLNESEAAL